MNFSGLTFLYLFLPAFLILYYLLPKRAENYVLVIGSVLFYAWGEPIFALLLINLAIVNYIMGFLLNKFAEDQTARFVILIIGVSINAGILLFGKFIPVIGTIINKMGNDFNIPNTVPLGIGFYVLSCISYIVDVYTKKAPYQRNFIKYMVYISMFPKLLAGPVVAYRNIYGQIENRETSIDIISSGIVLFIKGLGKKVLIADTLAVLCNKILGYDATQLSVATAWIGALALLIYFYFDISGYSDMARGLGRMLGFQLPKNFYFPFMARTVTDFIGRWHVSFMRWAKMYIYAPLDKYLIKKVGNIKIIANLTIIIFFVSIWHGFGYNFQTTAVFVLIILLVEHFLLDKFFWKIPRIFGRIYTLFIVLLSFSLLANKDFSTSLSYIASMFGLNGQPLYDSLSTYYFLSYLPILIISVLITTRFVRIRANRVKRLYPALYSWLTPVCCVAIFVLSTAFIINSEEIPFLYFMI